MRAPRRRRIALPLWILAVVAALVFIERRQVGRMEVARLHQVLHELARERLAAGARERETAGVARARRCGTLKAIAGCAFAIGADGLASGRREPRPPGQAAVLALGVFEGPPPPPAHARPRRHQRRAENPHLHRTARGRAATEEGIGGLLGVAPTLGALLVSGLRERFEEPLVSARCQVALEV